MKSIFYRPQIDIPKDYKADGSITRPYAPYVPAPPIKPSKQELVKLIENTKKLIPFVPGAIKKGTENILNLVTFFLVLIDENESNDENSDDKEKPGDIIFDVEENDPDDDDNNNDNNDDSFFSKNHKPITITHEKITKPIALERKYSKTILDVSREYLEKLRRVLGDYQLQLLKDPDLKEVLENLYDEDIKDFKPVAEMIAHNLIKSQRLKSSRLRLYEKLYNETTSLNLLRSLEYSRLLILKLYTSIPQDRTLMIKHMQLTFSEEKKIDKKLYELFKYLDSSVILTNECLNLHLSEALAKKELNKIKEEDKDNVKANA